MNSMLKVGQIYQHYKGNEYTIIALAKDCDSLDPVVVYQDKNDPSKIWVRSQAVFEEVIEKNGEQLPRFRLQTTYE